MKAIMYHYVREFNEDIPYFKNLHIEDFKKQLEYFESEYGFVSKEDFLNAISTGKNPDGIILTFDDGLKDHFTYVLPILLERSLWGIFYIPTLMYNDNKFLDVHRIHLLLGRFKGAIIYDELIKIVNNDMLTDKLKNESNELTYNLQINDNHTTLVKRILNYYISYKYREKVIDTLMERLIPEYQRAYQTFYMTPAEIKIIQEKGMIVGSHTVSHPVMSKLSLDEQKYQIENSFNFLERSTGGLHLKTFCYPYGGFHTFTKETVNILEKNDCLFSFNKEPRDIEVNDLLNNPQSLPRYDCNQFKYGQCRINTEIIQ